MFKVKDRVFCVGIILALSALMFGLFAGAALAQDTPTPDTATVSLVTPTAEPVLVEPPPPDPVVEEPGDPPATTPENLLGQIFALLKDGTYIVWAAAGVVVIVGLLKILAGAAGWVITGNTAVFITLVVQVLIWLVYAIANYFGQGEAFKAWYLQIVDVLRSLLPLVGSIFAGHVLYTQSAKRSVPVLGYKPKPKDVTVHVR